MRKPEDFGRDFAVRVRDNWPPDCDTTKMVVSDKGLVIAKNPGEKTGWRPLGCPTCFMIPRAQDSEGYPTVQGKRLRRAEDLGLVSSDTPPELSANMWHCPNCGLLIQNLLPAFDTSSIRRLD